ncbi:MAG TPA: hypothetical protein VHD63_04975 [Ktedonobacteraceae bacterium]|nr:hypothetical protein [Ktedonobacteraceae bacterium]
MSSAIVTAILVVLMLLVVGSFVFSAWLAHRRHMRVVEAQKADDGPSTGRMVVMVQLMDGSLVGVENQLPAHLTNKLPAVVPSAHLSHRWYDQRRTVVSLGLLFMLLIGVLIQTGTAGDVLSSLTRNLSNAAVQISGTGVQTAFQPLPYSASARITRVDSAAANQYATQYQYSVWSYSSCSGISLEEVMNAYGRHYIASDVLQVEQDLGIWDSYNGLTGGEAGMAKAAAHFGFVANPNPPRTLDALIAVANRGYPVIVGSTGHILVVKGGDANYVYLVDSAPANRVAMTHSQFMSFWVGFSVLVTPPNTYK